jgi:Ni/Co efflux regulator RcnB
VPYIKVTFASFWKDKMKKTVVMLLAAAIVMPTISAHASLQDAHRRHQKARDIRQDARTNARKDKRDCYVKNNKSNLDCRRDKKDTKRDGRRDAFDTVVGNK